MTAADVFDAFEPVIRAAGGGSPWRVDRVGGKPSYVADGDLLARLLAVPVGTGSGSQTGRLAKAIDAWLAHELRRAGFGDDEVWPRLTRPRVLPHELALFIDGLPIRERGAAQERLLRNRAAAPSDARVLGRAYVKQVDVVIARWSRGPELLVSTKSMVSSFRNNLPNRFEESYGDAANLRGRYPLASMGFMLLLRSTALEERGTLDRAVDMLRKLQDHGDAYDATGLVVAEWKSTPAFEGIRLVEAAVPEDLRIDRFIARLIDLVLVRTPVDMHVQVRERREHRDLALEESEQQEGPQSST